MVWIRPPRCASSGRARADTDSLGRQCRGGSGEAAGDAQQQRGLQREGLGLRQVRRTGDQGKADPDEHEGRLAAQKAGDRGVDIGVRCGSPCLLHRDPAARNDQYAAPPPLRRLARQIGDQTDQDRDAGGEDHTRDQRAVRRGAQPDQCRDGGGCHHRGNARPDHSGGRRADRVEARGEAGGGEQADRSQQQKRYQQGGGPEAAGADGAADQCRTEDQSDPVGGQQPQHRSGEAERRWPRRSAGGKGGDGGPGQQREQQETRRQRSECQIQDHARRPGRDDQRCRHSGE